MALNILYFGTNHSKSIKPLYALAQEHQIVGVVEWSPKEDTVKKILRQIYHYGKGLRREVKTLRSFAKNRKIPHINTHSCPITSGEFEEKIKNLQPDLICVSNFGERIPLNIIEIPKHGGINAHGSYLPNYRGAIPWFWQYYNMEKEGGVTIHRLSEKEDQGEILLQEKFPIELGLQEEQLLQRITKYTTKLLMETVEEIEQTGRIGANEGKIIPKEPENLFKGRCIQRGEKFIDWNTWEVERVYHFLRGTDAMELDPPFLGGIWEVQDYRKRKTPSEKTTSDARRPQAGDIRKTKVGYRLFCKNGEVLLQPQFTFKALITGMLAKR